MSHARRTQPPPKPSKATHRIAPAAAHAEKSSIGGTAARGGAVGSAAPASSARIAARAMARCATYKYVVLCAYAYTSCACACVASAAGYYFTSYC